MAIQQDNISLGYGIRRTPSLGEGGELSECVNLTPHGGELVNIQPPKDLSFETYDRETLIAVHETNKFKHYIIHYNNDVDSEQSVTEGDIKVYVVLAADGTTFKLSEACDEDVAIRFITVNGTRKTYTTFVIEKGSTYLHSDSVYSSRPPIINVGSASTTHTFQDARVIFTTDELEIDEDTALTTYEELYTKYNFTAIYWIDAEGTTYERVLLSTDNYVADINDIRIMGNTIIVLTSDGIKYYLWDTDTAKYRALGSSAPEIDMKFRLDGQVNIDAGANTLKLGSSGESVSELKYFGSTGSAVKSKVVPYFYDGEENSDYKDCYVFLPEGGFKKGHTYKFCIENFASWCLWGLCDKDDTGYYTTHSSTPSSQDSSKTKSEYFFDHKGYRIYGVVGFSKPVVKAGGYIQLYVTDDFEGLAIAGSMGDYYDYEDTCPFLCVIYESVTTSLSYSVLYNADNTQALMALANKTLNTSLTVNHKFVLPFFVRFAIELYDGSVTHQSTPILMLPNTGTVPLMLSPDITSFEQDGNISFTAIDTECNLQYFIEEECINKLKDWKDIISSINIYVSAPIYKYNEGASFTEEKVIWSTGIASKGELFDFYSLCRIDGEGSSVKTNTYDKAVSEGLLTEDSNFVYVKLPEFTDAEYFDKFRECSNFYKIKSVELNDLVSDTYTDVDVSNIPLTETGLSAREALQDDYNSHNSFKVKHGFCYNNRLSIANFSEQLYGGFNPASQIGDIQEDSTLYWYRAVVVVNNNSEILNSASDFYIDTNKVFALSMDPYWFYTPLQNAKKAIIYKTDGQGNYYKSEIDLTKHKYLNGYYWFNNLSLMEFDSCEESEATQTYDAPEISKDNTIYTSEVNNPFAFDIQMSCQVGSGEVMALSTSAKALSQGQFGEFPLYAFCTDGIWALSVSSEGKYSAKQPISRDVVSNADTITQIDNAVVFVTKQGLKIISGSEVQLLSEKIDGLNLSETFFEDAIPEALYIPDARQFTELVQDAKIVYDYAHGLLHIFMDDSKMHYVYDFATGEYSKQILDNILVTAVPGYPFTTMQMSDNNLYQYEKLYEDTQRQGFALTRSNAIGNPLSFKALYDLRTIGQRVSADTKFKIAVYISNDNVNWYRLTSLKMKSAKYYRFLVKTDMTDIETLSGISIQYQERYTGKMR